MYLYFVYDDTQKDLGQSYERLPIKWPEKSFIENVIFSMKMIIVDSTLNLSSILFLIGQVPIKKYGLKALFLLFNT